MQGDSIADVLAQKNFNCPNWTNTYLQGHKFLLEDPQ